MSESIDERLERMQRNAHHGNRNGTMADKRRRKAEREAEAAERIRRVREEVLSENDMMIAIRTRVPSDREGRVQLAGRWAQTRPTKVVAAMIGVVPNIARQYINEYRRPEIEAQVQAYADTVIRRRKMLGLSQAALARKMGVSRGLVANLESGRAPSVRGNITEDLKARIEDALRFD